MMAKLSAPRTVCSILHVFPSFEVGGTQVGFVRVANHWGRRFAHVVISLDGDISCAPHFAGNLDCRVLPLLMHKSHTLNLANLVDARRTVRESGADLLITYSWGAIEWALANRWLPVCRHIHVEDGFNPDEADGRQKLRRILFRRVALGGHTLVVVPSRTLHRIATETWGFNPSRVLHVPNGIEVEKFATGADPSILPELQSRSSELVIGTISGLRQVKRIDRLIRAFAALPPDIRACLVIVGDGPERTRLEEIAAEVGIADRTFFTGNIAAPERVFGLFDVFALTSDSEQMPYALIEAMAAGLPIVATDVGDVKAIVAPENRPLIVPSASVDALISALCELARNARQRRVLGYHNQEKARREFGAATMMKTYEALFAGTLQ
jgi:glycosyltransferase involved in cell wall biosynthesis